jgi:hypothetical protein
MKFQKQCQSVKNNKPGTQIFKTTAKLGNCIV